MLNLKQLQSLLMHVTNPSGGQFYRNHYKMSKNVSALEIDSFLEWRKLPPVTKDDLINVSLKERTFIPLSALDHLRVSSGTSGKPPLFSPRTEVRNMEYREKYYDFKNAFMVFTVPMMPHWHEDFIKSLGFSPRVVVFDPKYPSASIRLAKAAGVEGISLFVYQVQAVGECMKQEGMNMNIRLIEITGETCSRLLYEYMCGTFPNATILQSYGASEVEDVHMGMPCKPMDGSEPLAVYHQKDTHYLEVVDPDTGKALEPKKGVEGELLVTAYPGEPSAFPLIRFQIGDMVRVVEGKCPHGSWSFTVLGRVAMDFMKISGGVLRVDEISRVLRLFPEQVSDLFELHCYMKESDKGPLLRPILKVETRGDPDLKVLARDIEKNLRTGPSHTYAEGVTAGMYLSIQCKKLKKENKIKKHQWIVKH